VLINSVGDLVSLVEERSSRDLGRINELVLVDGERGRSTTRIGKRTRRSLTSLGSLSDSSFEGIEDGISDDDDCQ
jgi:hypothetical protein